MEGVAAFWTWENISYVASIWHEKGFYVMHHLRLLSDQETYFLDYLGLVPNSPHPKPSLQQVWSPKTLPKVA